MDPAASFQPAQPSPLSRPVGSTIADKYVLLEQIGTGSMGSVYRARHTALERDVAIKLMAPELARDRSFAARFRREAHAASRLTHVSSVMITDFGEEPDGLLYLVMEYVRGQSLEAMIESGQRLDERRIVEILSQVLSAVAVAHAAGIVHRDLKPANVLVVETTDDDGSPVDVVKVCDFGVASLRDRAELLNTSRYAAIRPGDPRGGRQLTMAGAVVGTPAYMAPEQASGGVQDARTDLYSLGIVLFEMLTGKLPLWGDTLEETMLRQIDTPAPSPRDLVDCTPALADVCLRALSKRPEDRFESARAMRAALRAALASDEAAVVVPSAPPFEATESLAGVAAIREQEAPVAETPRRSLAWPWMVAAVAAGAVASITWLTHGRPYEAAAHRLVDRAETFLPAAVQPTSAELPAPATAPERAPLTVAPVAEPTPVPPVVAKSPAAAPPVASRKTKERARSGGSAGAAHGAEPAAELAVADAPAAEAAADPAPSPAEEAKPAAEDAPRSDTDKAWATRR